MSSYCAGVFKEMDLAADSIVKLIHSFALHHKKKTDQNHSSENIQGP